MSRKLVALSLAILVVALAAGCVSAPAPAPVPPTKTPKPTFTPTPDWTPTSIVIPTATAAPASPTPEATATAVPTETPVPPAQLTANQNVNVRSGPGTAYPSIGRLTLGQSFDITGRNDAGDWIKFDLNGQDGWVTSTLVRISGDLEGVEVAMAPAVPTARPQPTARPRPVQPTAVPQPTSPPAPPAPSYPFTYVQGSADCQPNAGTTYFNGFIRFRDNSPRNGVCVHIAFYGPRQTKCSGCNGVGDGVWGLAPFGPGAPPTGQVEIYVVSCDGVTGGEQNQFNGPPAPVSDKFVRTLTEGVQCTGITFVGD